ncbi:hypothetical protein MHIB_14040 [Mycolicibacter hiberniae]|uniref:Uncharacterized protein n=1 Tax=Mycolicibacter hiberniae TaxID=29314 RepID=A0A7I7WZP9_9MYCO|nr:hypothetical protein MHIB_14040 [Mycolicibacter hiberniae]
MVASIVLIAALSGPMCRSTKVDAVCSDTWDSWALDDFVSSPSVVCPARAPERFGAGAGAFPHGRV